MEEVQSRKQSQSQNNISVIILHDIIVLEKFIIHYV